MRVLGIIAEYNPFHNGHKLHLQTAKRELGADYCVVVMSGSFVQRGEPALIHKWKRAEMCLLNGADLVIELPVHYATASAEYFAEAAVKLLASTNIADFLSFGVESGTTDDFSKAADYIINEPPEYKTLLKAALSKGKSFPSARAEALGLVSVSPGIYETPNNILAIEYLKALRKMKSTMLPHTVTRNTEHNSDIPGERFSSASAIRSVIKNGGFAEIRGLVPEETYGILEKSRRLLQTGYDGYSDMLIYKIKSLPKERLRGIFDVSEGLENRIAAAADNETISAIISQIKTKRYTLTKIQRILTHILLGITAEDMDAFAQNGGPSYIRVLGFKRSSERLMKRLAENASLPVIVNIGRDVSRLDEISLKMLQKELYATDVYFIKCPERTLRRSGIEYSIPIVTV